MSSSGAEHSHGTHKSTGFNHQHLKDTTTTKVTKQRIVKWHRLPEMVTSEPERPQRDKVNCIEASLIKKHEGRL